MERKDNVTSYIRLRGDLSFKEDPFNEVDALIFTLISYFDFNHIVSSGIKQTSIQEAYNEILAMETSESEYEQQCIKNEDFIDPSSLVNSHHKNSFDYERELLKEMALSKRFAKVTLSHFVDETNSDITQQFCALHIHFDNNKTFISFRGTDDTLIGWKENWQMLYKSPVSAQLRAVTYLNETVDTHLLNYFHQYYMGGHSKGGNLAFYGALFCKEKVIHKIKDVYSFDGPGFLNSFDDLTRYKKIKKHIHNYTPQFSVIAMTLDHYYKDKTVESFYEGMRQHDGYSWIVAGNHFLEATRDEESIKIEMTFKNWIHSIPKEEREAFVNAIFEVLEKSNVETLTQFLHLNITTLINIVRSMIHIDANKRNMIISVLLLLMKSREGQKDKSPLSTI